MADSSPGFTDPGWVCDGIPAERAPNTVDSSLVVQFLNQTIDWYRQRAAEHQIGTDPDDVLVIMTIGKLRIRLYGLPLSLVGQKRSPQPKVRRAGALRRSIRRSFNWRPK